MKKDGHIHTPYCPHGTEDSFHMYIEQAIQSDFGEITFTEHAPLPFGFLDPTPNKDSGMSNEPIRILYLRVTKVEKEYNQDIVISTGLEIDFITGFEQNTTSFLNTYGKYLDDSILSVHFLKYEDDYTCIDFSKSTFLEFIDSTWKPNVCV